MLPAVFRGVSATGEDERYDSDVAMKDAVADAASDHAASAPSTAILGLWKGFVVTDDGGKLLHITEKRPQRDDGQAQDLMDLHKEGKNWVKKAKKSDTYPLQAIGSYDQGSKRQYVLMIKDGDKKICVTKSDCQPFTNKDELNRLLNLVNDPPKKNRGKSKTPSKEVPSKEPIADDSRSSSDDSRSSSASEDSDGDSSEAPDTDEGDSSDSSIEEVLPKLRRGTPPGRHRTGKSVVASIEPAGSGSRASQFTKRHGRSDSTPSRTSSSGYTVGKCGYGGNTWYMLEKNGKYKVKNLNRFDPEAYPEVSQDMSFNSRTDQNWMVNYSKGEFTPDNIRIVGVLKYDGLTTVIFKPLEDLYVRLLQHRKIWEDTERHDPTAVRSSWSIFLKVANVELLDRALDKLGKRDLGAEREMRAKSTTPARLRNKAPSGLQTPSKSPSRTPAKSPSKRR